MDQKGNEGWGHDSCTDGEFTVHESDKRFFLVKNMNVYRIIRKTPNEFVSVYHNTLGVDQSLHCIVFSGCHMLLFHLKGVHYVDSHLHPQVCERGLKQWEGCKLLFKSNASQAIPEYFIRSV
jgi:hypothetical protein